MGHDSARAALIYQHATTGADHKIADALARRIEAAHSARSAATGPPARGHNLPGTGTLMAHATLLVILFRVFCLVELSGHERSFLVHGPALSDRGNVTSPTVTSAEVVFDVWLGRRGVVT